MFGFDRAYSLKRLASGKQGLFCKTRLWLTWDCALISLIHSYVCAHTQSRWPTARHSSVSI